MEQLLAVANTPSLDIATFVGNHGPAVWRQHGRFHLFLPVPQISKCGLILSVCRVPQSRDCLRFLSQDIGLSRREFSVFNASGESAKELMGVRSSGIPDAEAAIQESGRHGRTARKLCSRLSAIAGGCAFASGGQKRHRRRTSAPARSGWLTSASGPEMHLPYCDSEGNWFRSGRKYDPNRAVVA